jgi:hypothetical protein
MPSLPKHTSTQARPTKSIFPEVKMPKLPSLQPLPKAAGAKSIFPSSKLPEFKEPKIDFGNKLQRKTDFPKVHFPKINLPKLAGGLK